MLIVHIAIYIEKTSFLSAKIVPGGGSVGLDGFFGKMPNMHKEISQVLDFQRFGVLGKLWACFVHALCMPKLLDFQRFAKHKANA